MSAAIDAGGASDRGKTALGRRLDRAGKRAVPEDSKRHSVLAARRPTGPARAADAALRIGVDGHALADREAVRVAAHGPDAADELVAHDDAGIGRVTRWDVEDLEVRAANSARLDLDDDIVGRLDDRFRNFFELDGAGAFEDSCSHQGRAGSAPRRRPRRRACPRTSDATPKSRSVATSMIVATALMSGVTPNLT